MLKVLEGESGMPVAHCRLPEFYLRGTNPVQQLMHLCSIAADGNSAVMQAVVSMFNDAFAKAQSLPLFSEDEDEPAPAPAPALATRSHGMREADAQVAAAPSQLQDELASLSSLKDLVNPEYLKATERITKAFEQLAQQAKLAPAPSTAMPKDGNLDKKLQ